MNISKKLKEVLPKIQLKINAPRNNVSKTKYFKIYRWDPEQKQKPYV